MAESRTGGGAIRHRVIRALVAVALAGAVPLAELALACRRPISEECVWGTAYLPLSVALWIVFAAPIVYAVLARIANARARP